MLGIQAVTTADGHLERVLNAALGCRLYHFPTRAFQSRVA